MKKMFTGLTLFILLFTLSACGGDDLEEVTLPSFNRIEVEERSPIEGSELFAFIKEKQETIRVEVFLTNPSNLNINAITIAGITYRTPRFEEGSNNNRVIIEHTVGQIPGEIVNAVQEIEYIYEVTKTVEVTENNEYKIFVLKSVPSATFNRLTPSTNAIELEVNLTDIDNVLVNGRVELLHEGDVIATQTVSRGVQTRSFAGLLTDQAYNVRIVGDYNLDDGQGLVVDYTLSTVREVVTLESASPTITINNQTISDTSFSFNYTFVDTSLVLIENGLRARLLHDGTLVESITLSPEGTSAIVFDDLLNDNEYTLEIEADYDLRDGSGVREAVVLHTETFETPERDIPQITLSNETITESSIGFRVDTSSLEGLADFDTIRVRLIDLDTDEVLVESAILDSNLYYEVVDLFSNQAVRVEVRAMVDLSDGEGVQETVVFSSDYATTRNALPSATVTIVNFTQTTITFSTNITDANQTIVNNGMRAELYEDSDGTVTKIADKLLPASSGTYAFDVEPTSTATYTIKIYASYDLRDGEGVQELDLDATYSKRPTRAKTPVIESLALTSTQSSVTVNYSVLDNDETITTLILRLNDTDYILDDLSGSLTIEGLHSDSNYSAQIIAEYTITTSKEEVLATESIRTDSYASPTVTIVDPVPTSTGVSFDLDISDPFEFATITSFAVYRGSTLVQEITDVNHRVFANLLSNTEYRLVVTVTYDLLDQQGTRTTKVETVFRTLTKTSPSVSLENRQEDKGSISFDVVIEDSDNTLVDDTLSVILRDGETIIETLTIISSSQVTFTNLENSKNYTLEVRGDIDMNLGTIASDALLTSTSITTMDLSPSIELGDTSIEKEKITLRLDYSDQFDIVDASSLRLGLYDNNDLLVGSLRRLDHNVGMTLFNLWSDYTYTVKIYGDVDFNDGEGIQTQVLLFEEEMTTLPYVFPIPELIDLAVDPTAGNMQIGLSAFDDVDEVYTGMRLVLYSVTDDGFVFLEEHSIDLNDVQDDYTFTQFDPAVEYRIRLYASFDLHDSNGLIENEMLGEVAPLYAEKN